MIYQLLFQAPETQNQVKILVLKMHVAQALKIKLEEKLLMTLTKMVVKKVANLAWQMLKSNYIRTKTLMAR